MIVKSLWDRLGLTSSLKVGLSVAWITGDIFLFHSISDKLLSPVDC